ncbi:MAG: mucoidy inhibitor MuiA family protein [Cytophagaceae bacterium]
MNRRIYFLLVLFSAFQINLHAGDKKSVKAEIKQVTVFLNKAQVNNLVNTSVDAGVNEIMIEGLPSFIDKNSIQVSGKGDFIIMNVRWELNYLSPHKKHKEMLVVEDSLEHLRTESDKVKNLMDILGKEEQMILANQSIKGSEKNLTADELEEMADFFRERLLDIRNEIGVNNKKFKNLQDRIRQYQQQLAEVTKLYNRESGTIYITTSAKARTNAVFEIQYITGNAGWSPLYDLRAKDTKSPVQVSYKAQVYQNTGLNWDKVKLKLSTANPTLGGTKPELATQYLYFYNPVAREAKPAAKYKKMEATGSVERSASAPDELMDYKLEDKRSEVLSDYTTVTQTTLAAEFDIAVPYSIPSDGQVQLVDIQNYDLPASYRHYSVPKLDQDAFLVAQVTGWEELNMLSGNANIYFEGTYVGESFIDMENISDTLIFSLGRDKKVVVERKKVKDFSSKSFIGTNRKEESAYEINIRNTGKTPIVINLEDQIPVSRDKEIEVELTDSGGALFDKTTGKMTWQMTLNASETRKVGFKYFVKYPKNKRVQGL